MNINQNLAELLFTWQKTMWCGVMVLGIEFTFLAAILRKDKVFMLLGANILILSAMAGIDIWFLDPSIYQKMHGPIFLELCNDVFHVLTCCFLAALMWLTKMLVNQPSQASAQAHSLILGAFGGAFIFDAILPGTLFIEYHDWIAHSTWVYDWVFTPYVVGIFGWIIFSTIRAISGASSSLKKTLKLLSGSYFVLFISGLLDLRDVILSDKHFGIVSFTEFGVLAIGISGTLIFTRNIIDLFINQRSTLLEVNEINNSQSADMPLQILGLSTTRVVKEIQNHVSRLKKDSMYLEQPGYFINSKETDRFEKARKNLEKYTVALLNFASCSKLGKKTAYDSSLLLNNLRERLLKEELAKISFSGRSDCGNVGDIDKLGQALFEIVVNAIQAGSKNIKIRFIDGFGVTSLVVEDDGDGCSEEDIKKIQNPFFTTKKIQGSLGLGAAIARGIVDSHGGHIRYYPKFDPNGQRRGLFVNVILPNNGNNLEDSENGQGTCVLVSDNSNLVEEVLCICRSIGFKSIIAGALDASIQNFASSAGRKGIIILDEPKKPKTKVVWKIGHAYIYCCDSLRRISPLNDPIGYEGNSPLCAESILQIFSK